eukprot:8436344-Lingulodinium_polyedra.AAC.1
MRGLVEDPDARRLGAQRGHRAADELDADGGAAPGGVLDLAHDELPPPQGREEEVEPLLGVWAVEAEHRA